MERTYIKNVIPGEKNTIAGFVENIRNKRTMAFLVIRDVTGKIQVTVEKAKLPEIAELCDKLTLDSVVTVEGEDVIARVGAVDHPMLDVHYIEWIAFADGTKIGIKFLNPGDAPEATFTKTAETGTVYAYCNLHGLWKADC